MATTSQREWQFTSALPWASEDFHRILRFYLFECPCDGTSARSRTLAASGWGDARLQGALRDTLVQAASDGFVFRICERRDQVDSALGELGLLNQLTLHVECAVFLRSKRPALDTLFAHVRNAFAHGRVSVFEDDAGRTYALEDEYRGDRNARMILKESTLLSWSELVRRGPESESVSV